MMNERSDNDNITREELSRRQADGDQFAGALLKQWDGARTPEEEALVQRNANRVYGRGEFGKSAKPPQAVSPDTLTKDLQANTGLLLAIKDDPSLPRAKRALAEQFQRMRASSKSRGLSTEAIDRLAGQQLAREILAKQREKQS